MARHEIRNYGIFFVVALLVLSGMFLLIIPLLRLSPENFAFDWRESFHGAIWRENFGWESHPFHVPPWSVLLLLPLTALPFYLGWALMMAFTTISHVLVIPPYPRVVQRIGLLLFFTAYPVIRNFADVNLEAYVVLGVLLTLYAYQKQNPYLLALAVLIATIKPQNVSLLMLILGLYILQSFPRPSIFIFGGIVGLVLTASMLVWGVAWWHSLGTTPLGSSLNESFEMLGLPVAVAYGLQAVVALITVALVWRGDKRLSRLKTGLLISASMLISPHAHLTSFVTLLAFAGIALLEKRFWLGVLVFALVNSPYLYRLSLVPVNLDNTVFISSLLFVIWLILLLVFYQEEVQPHAYSQGKDPE